MYKIVLLDKQSHIANALKTAHNRQVFKTHRGRCLIPLIQYHTIINIKIYFLFYLFMLNVTLNL